MVAVVDSIPSIPAHLTLTLCSLSVLKTTQAGFENFWQDEFTTLPEAADRILATTISAEWTYNLSKYDALQGLAFKKIHNHMRTTMLREFYGPSDVGHMSYGVQDTLFKMAKNAKLVNPEVETVTLSLPNLHFTPCMITAGDFNFEDDIYIPTEDPHGIISATVGSPGRRMSKI